MNVDKFGHQVHKRLRLSSEKLNNQLVLVKSENGEYDFNSSYLKGVKAPVDLNDAVNKEYVDKTLDKYCTLQQLQRELSNLRSNLLLVFNKNFEDCNRIGNPKDNRILPKNE